jgi:hypothetical protein
MSNEQYSPWASGDGFGTPRPQPARAEEPPTLEQPMTQFHVDPTTAYTNPTVQPHHPAEPSGWSQPQQFGAVVPQPQYPSPAAAYTFGQRLPYGTAGELPEHPNATVTLVLGIIGLAALFIAFPFISPVAWYLGGKARRDMRREPGRYRASGSLTAGYVLGIVGTLIAVAFVGLIVLGIAMVASFGR